MRFPTRTLVLLLSLATIPAGAEAPQSLGTTLEPLLIVTPTYSEGFQKAHANGTAVVTTLVSPDGHPTSPVLAKKTGFPFLDTACLNAVARSRFRPHHSDAGLPATFTYTFELTAAGPAETCAVIDPTSLTIRVIGFHIFESSIS